MAHILRYLLSREIQQLLQLLAFQIGSEASLTEIATTIGMSKDTKMDKIFFYDLGIRNTIISNMKPLKERNDMGQLWENFLMIERKKLLAYTFTFANLYFWRTYTGAELDYVEEREGRLYGYEFKYKKSTTKPPLSWKEAYPNNPIEVINQNNYLPFILER